jgi:hypothetical protein
MAKEIFKKSFFCQLIIIFFVTFICFVMNNNIYADTIRPLAIMIGNSPEEITNQTGLGNADVIYEVNVEFPFTRLMAIFINNDSYIVGPVRSSRYYFSRLAAEWSPVFAHCGGQSLKNEKTVNLDQMHYSSPYWRNERIGGWIDLFTNTKNLREKCRELGFKDRIILNNSLVSQRKLDLSGGNISKIFIKYNQKYSISYKYDSDSNTYLRYINSQPHQDSENSKQLSVSNIIIQYVPVKKIPGDKKGRLEVSVIGEGIAKIFYGGHYFISKWIKKSKDQPTLYYNNQGELLNLNRGKIWIQIVSEETKVWFK